MHRVLHPIQIRDDLINFFLSRQLSQPKFAASLAAPWGDISTRIYFIANVVRVGPIAQWLEQGTHNALVAGSNPAGPIEPDHALHLRGDLKKLSGLLSNRLPR
jgi:hypothetical protein